MKDQYHTKACTASAAKVEGFALVAKGKVIVGVHEIYLGVNMCDLCIEFFMSGYGLGFLHR